MIFRSQSSRLTLCKPFAFIFFIAVLFGEKNHIVLLFAMYLKKLMLNKKYLQIEQNDPMFTYVAVVVIIATRLIFVRGFGV